MVPVDDGESSGAARILDAALYLFGEHGHRGTTLKAIAVEAGVSQALIVHHYGSKDALRAACDDHVVRMIPAPGGEAIGEEPQFDPFAGLRQLERSRPLLRYLVRALTEGGTHASDLIDGMIADAESYLAQGEHAGLIKPSSVPRDRVVLLVIWSLGALTLHEQVNRLLGVDLLAHDVQPGNMRRYLRPAVELYRQGLLEEGALDGLTEFLAEPDVEEAKDNDDDEDDDEDDHEKGQ